MLSDEGLLICPPVSNKYCQTFEHTLMNFGVRGDRQHDDSRAGPQETNTWPIQSREGVQAMVGHPRRLPSQLSRSFR